MIMSNLDWIKPAPSRLFLLDRWPVIYRKMKSPALGAGLPANFALGALELGRQIAVNLKADADFNDDWCSPGHLLVLLSPHV